MVAEQGNTVSAFRSFYSPLLLSKRYIQEQLSVHRLLSDTPASLSGVGQREREIPEWRAPVCFSPTPLSIGQQDHEWVAKAAEKITDGSHFQKDDQQALFFQTRMHVFSIIWMLPLVAKNHNRNICQDDPWPGAVYHAARSCQGRFASP